MLNLLINSLMKKQLFLVVVAALAMASCSKDESTGINNGNAIDFRAAMQTRASETTMANITNLFVTARLTVFHQLVTNLPNIFVLLSNLNVTQTLTLYLTICSSIHKCRILSASSCLHL